MDAPVFEVDRFLRKVLDAASLTQLQVYQLGRTDMHVCVPHRMTAHPVSGAKCYVADRDCQPGQRHAAVGVRKLLKIYHRN